jgi:hypothetical protein
MAILTAVGCDAREANTEFERQMEICSARERSGLLESASSACHTALRIAEKQKYETAVISCLLHRLGRLKRQRGRFEDGEILLRRSLALEQEFGEPETRALLLVELSFTLAGQGRWIEGADLLVRAFPTATYLSGVDRQSAVHAYSAFGVRLARLGHAHLSEKLSAKADELTIPRRRGRVPPPTTDNCLDRRAVQRGYM